MLHAVEPITDDTEDKTLVADEDEGMLLHEDHAFSLDPPVEEYMLLEFEQIVVFLVVRGLVLRITLVCPFWGWGNESLGSEPEETTPEVDDGSTIVGIFMPNREVSCCPAIA